MPRPRWRRLAENARSHRQPDMSTILLVALALLQAADAYTTWRILSAGGRELNPAMRYAIAQVLALYHGGGFLTVDWRM